MIDLVTEHPTRPATLGIDPGSARGAACLLSPAGGLLRLADWRQGKRGGETVYKLRIWTPGQELRSHLLPRCPTVLAHALAEWVVPAGMRPEVAIEDAYLGKHARGSLELIRWAGTVAGAVSAWLNAPAPRWVLASVWRAPILGLPANAGRERCKRVSLSMMPQRLPGLAAGLAAIGPLDHLTDAAGIAQWAQLDRSRS